MLIPVLFAQTFHGSRSASSQPHWDLSHFLVIHLLPSHTGSNVELQTLEPQVLTVLQLTLNPWDKRGESLSLQPHSVGPEPDCALWLKCGVPSHTTRHGNSNSSQAGQSLCLLCLFCCPWFSCVSYTMLWCQPALPSKNILFLGSSRSYVHRDSSWDFSIRL